MSDFERAVVQRAAKLLDDGDEFNGQAQQVYANYIEECNRLVSANQEGIFYCRKNLALSYNNRGHLKYLRVDFDEAVGDYSQALIFDSKLTVAYYNRGLIHYRLGRFPEAISDFEKALEINSTFEDAREALSVAIQDKQKKQTTDCL